jgi:ribonuclease HI
MVMVNVDAAIFASSRRMGTGVVIRDHNGICVAACSERNDEVVTPEIAEAMAMRRAISLAKDEGYDKIIINSDCLSVVQRVIAESEDCSTCDPMIHDIRNISNTFTSCSFRHVNRALNVAAHCLAKLSESVICTVWHGVVPDYIREKLCNDIMIM